MHAGPCDAGCRASAICGLQRTRTDSPFPCTDLPLGMTMDDVLRHLAKDIMCWANNTIPSVCVYACYTCVCMCICILCVYVCRFLFLSLTGKFSPLKLHYAGPFLGNFKGGRGKVQVCKLGWRRTWVNLKREGEVIPCLPSPQTIFHMPNSSRQLTVDNTGINFICALKRHTCTHMQRLVSVSDITSSAVVVWARGRSEREEDKETSSGSETDT